MNYLGPLISVVMPAYNADKYIGYAIESILNQTYFNLELIIVEDGSTDDTDLIIRQYKDSRIRVIKNSCNKGIAYSTNKGIEASRGKYIALMDDDDIAVEKRLEYQVDYLEHHQDIDILGGRSVQIDAFNKEIRFENIPRNNPDYIRAILLFNCMDFRNGTAMMRKDFIIKNKLRYEENCLGMQDFKFYIDSSKIGNISSIGNLLLKYRVHEGNETKRRIDYYKEDRARLYAEFQRQSLSASGFNLGEESLTLINKVLAEQNGCCGSFKELQNLYLVFYEILQQARKMKVGYYKELQHLCKSHLAKQLLKMDIWSGEIVCRINNM